MSLRVSARARLFRRLRLALPAWQQAGYCSVKQGSRFVSQKRKPPSTKSSELGVLHVTLTLCDIDEFIGIFNFSNDVPIACDCESATAATLHRADEPPKTQRPGIGTEF